jgi:uncharacterized protein (TIGR02246 family)
MRAWSPTDTAVQTLVALGIVALGACAPPDGDHAEAARAAIAEAREAFWDAHLQGNADALADLVTPDAVLLAQGMEEVSGREAIRDAARQMFDAMTITDFAVLSQEMDVHDSVAYELATYSETLRMGDADEATVRGRYLIVWRQESDGHWRVHRNQFHFVTPPPH